MTVHSSALLTILLMAAVTYALRAGGYWMMGRVTLSPRMEAGLAYLPGAVITALVVPSAIDAGAPSIVGLMAVAIIMRLWRNLFLALVVGIGTVWLLRQAI
ncbi:MAG TPA: AzlD domain-containing protein [Thermomicrobiales bacterium]|nr:AzlD domain-containing protein [Thermomicrobiales bacterium]